jgi:hypothetical protein
MKTYHRLPVIALAGALAASGLLLTSGCLAVAAGAGAAAGVAYVRGDLEATLNAGLDQSIRATDKAVQQLAYAKVSEKKDALLDTFVVRNSADKKIEIRLENAGEGLTKVRIRVGVFGDETLSRAVFDKIKASL